MREIREIILRILETYEEVDKFLLARQLAEALELVDTGSLVSKIEAVLDRRLSKQEVFRVDTLGLIMRDKRMFHGNDDCCDDEDYEDAKAGF